MKTDTLLLGDVIEKIYDLKLKHISPETALARLISKSQLRFKKFKRAYVA